MFKLTAYYTVIWIILTESLKPANIAVGAVISILVLLFTCRVFDKKSYTKVYGISFVRLVVYFAYLVGLIYKSGFETIIRIALNSDKTCVTEYRSGLTNQFNLCLLANAITLTPGTVSLDLNGSTLTILSFTDRKGNPGVDIGTLKRLEHILERREL